MTNKQPPFTVRQWRRLKSDEKQAYIDSCLAALKNLNANTDFCSALPFVVKRLSDIDINVRLSMNTLKITWNSGFTLFFTFLRTEPDYRYVLTKIMSVNKVANCFGLEAFGVVSYGGEYVEILSKYKFEPPL
jgi:hypothetical protein